MSAIVAIVGRPNVGKSTLFNRLAGRRIAIVDDYPGATRDRNYALITRHEKPFTLVDTGGFEPVSKEHLLTQMREQSRLAMEEADVILFVLDAREGLTPADRDVAEMLRRVEKPVFFIVNKVEGPAQEAAAGEFYTLGVDNLCLVSAEHGLGMGELTQRIQDALPAASMPEEEEERQETRLAVLGRPNVGKSSLVNRLLGYERVIANPEAGTTRDSVDTRFEHQGKTYLLIDTAGIRRKGRVSLKLEKYAVVQALRSLDRCHVALMLIDAVEGITDQDLTIAGYAHERGRAVVLVVNKWDLVQKDNATTGRFVQEVRRTFKFLPDCPVHFVSAATGQRVARIMADVEKVDREFSKRITTAELNRVLKDAEISHPPPMYKGKRLKLFYMTQVSVRPPTFVIFVSRAAGIHFSYQRYLVNCLRQAFGFIGCPIRLKFKDREH
ncbi:MAG TPA: ribosome biogenesis GTPase Der [Desulfuromonadales bacterium]|nr:ribosome biogenesis GTPase Der [Desulfuromonadales bacterium]